MLGSLATVAGALVVVAAGLGKLWLGAIGVAAALVAVLAFVSTLVSARLEDERERVEERRLTRVRIEEIGSVNPTDVGVDRATQTILGGRDVPEYLAREIDEELHSALEAGLRGDGRWIVVLVGSSKVGKSRTLFEALRRCSAGTGKHELKLVAPVDGDAVRSLLTPGLSPTIDAARCVLWLDDLEPFLAQGMTLQALREWHESGPGRIVAATYGGKGSDTVRAITEISAIAVADEVLQHAREIRMQATTKRELQPLTSRLEQDISQAIERHGLAAYLVAAPMLERKLATGRSAPNGPECPEGVAVVRAAIDWARAGRTDPIAESTLRQLWPQYLPTSVRPTDTDFQAGLEWGVRAVAGSIGLLQHTMGYRPYDYLVGAAEDQPDGPLPNQAIWKAAIDGANDIEALEVGRRAALYGRLDDAMAAYRRAARSSEKTVATIGIFNVGVTLSEMGDQRMAMKSIEKAIEGFKDAEDEDLQVFAAVAVLARGVMLMGSGRAEEAIEVFDRLAARLGDAVDPALRERAVFALLNRGAALGILHRDEEAIEVFEDVFTQFGDSREPVLQGIAAAALAAKGFTQARKGERGAAIATWRALAEHYKGVLDPSVRLEVAEAQVMMGQALHTLERSQEALVAFDDAIASCGNARGQKARESLAGAIVGRGQALASLGRWDQAISAWDAAIRTFSDATETPIREQVAIAVVRRGDVLLQDGHFDAAITYFDRVLAAAHEAPDSQRMRTAVSAARAYKQEALARKVSPIPKTPRRR